MFNNTIFFIKCGELNDKNNICCYSGDSSLGYTIHELYRERTEEGKEYTKTNKIPFRFSTEIELFSYVKKYLITILKIDSNILTFDVYDGDNNRVYLHDVDRKASLIYELLEINEKNYSTILNLIREIDLTSINYFRLRNLCNDLNRLNTSILLNIENSK